MSKINVAKLDINFCFFIIIIYLFWREGGNFNRYQFFSDIYSMLGIIHKPVLSVSSHWLIGMFTCQVDHAQGDHIYRRNVKKKKKKKKKKKSKIALLFEFSMYGIFFTRLSCVVLCTDYTELILPYAVPTLTYVAIRRGTQRVREMDANNNMFSTFGVEQWTQ